MFNCSESASFNVFKWENKFNYINCFPDDYILILRNYSFHSADILILQMRNDTERNGSIRESENNYTQA